MRTLQCYDSERVRITVEEMEEGFLSTVIDKKPKGTINSAHEKYPTYAAAMDRAFEWMKIHCENIEILLNEHESLEEESLEYEECPYCYGKGYFTSYGKPSDDETDRPCLECHGAGKVAKKEEEDSFEEVTLVTGDGSRRWKEIIEPSEETSIKFRPKTSDRIWLDRTTTIGWKVDENHIYIVTDPKPGDKVMSLTPGDWMMGINPKTGDIRAIRIR